MKNLEEIYGMCSGLTTAYITITQDYEVWDDGKKHRSCYVHSYSMIIISIVEVEYYAKMFGIPVSHTFLYILLHEIGHSLDPSIEECDGENSLKFEETAWKIADGLMDKLKYPKTKSYYELREYSLSDYR